MFSDINNATTNISKNFIFCILFYIDYVANLIGFAMKFILGLSVRKKVAQNIHAIRIKEIANMIIIKNHLL